MRSGGQVLATGEQKSVRMTPAFRNKREYRQTLSAALREVTRASQVAQPLPVSLERCQSSDPVNFTFSKSALTRSGKPFISWSETGV